MKAISIGKRYEIHEDSLKAYDKLPVNTYTVRFDKMSGFYLEARSRLAVTEKVYGIHPEKADKVLKAFSMFERSLGVILSGSKVIGKSLFARFCPLRRRMPAIPSSSLTSTSPALLPTSSRLSRKWSFCSMNLTRPSAASALGSQ